MRNLLNLMQRPPRIKILSLHIPKTGGVSLNRALKELYFDYLHPTKNYAVNLSHNAARLTAGLHGLSDQQIRDVVLHYFLAGGQSPYRLVAGHFRYTAKIIDALGPEWRVAAVLREPQSRWLSEFNYNRFKASSHYKVDVELDAYLQSSQAAQGGRCYLSIFQSEGQDKGLTDVTRSMVTQAKQNLERVHLLGLLEELDQFQSRIENMLDRKLWIGFQNRNPAPSTVRDKPLDSNTRQRIAELCAPDIEIYQYAQELLRRG